MKRICKYCNKEVKSHRNIYCNSDCFYNHKKELSLINRPNCLICGKKTKHNKRKCCSVRCSYKYKLKMYPTEIYKCYLCDKEVKKFTKICKQCKSKGFHKIYINYGISTIREYIKTKNYCQKHLNFYDHEKYCMKCLKVNKFRNIKVCNKCGNSIPLRKTLCRKCLEDKFINV